MSITVRQNPDDPACRPRPLSQRLGLLLILLVLPAAIVVMPAIAVKKGFFVKGGIFGQKSVPSPKPNLQATMAGLGQSLNHSAESLLPTPAPLTPEPIRLQVRPSRLDARVAKITALAQSLGGAAVEGVSAVGEKHLYVDLPGGSGPAFRQAVIENAASPAAPATTSAASGGARDQLEIILQGDEDE